MRHSVEFLKKSTLLALETQQAAGIPAQEKLHIAGTAANVLTVTS